MDSPGVKSVSASCDSAPRGLLASFLAFFSTLFVFFPSTSSSANENKRSFVKYPGNTRSTMTAQAHKLLITKILSSFAMQTFLVPETLVLGCVMATLSACAETDDVAVESRWNRGFSFVR